MLRTISRRCTTTALRTRTYASRAASIRALPLASSDQAIDTSYRSLLAGMAVVGLTTAAHCEASTEATPEVPSTQVAPSPVEVSQPPIEVDQPPAQADQSPVALDFDRQVDVRLARSTGHVRSYTCASYRANAPIEDRFLVEPTKRDVLATVIDGHGGWQVAEFAHTHLLDHVKAELAQHPSNPASALQQGFLRTEHELKNTLLPAFQLGFGQLNRIGACALVAYATEDQLYVANAGDCRAVLGSTDSDGRWVATALSNDHSANLISEQERLAKEHPNEDNIVVCKEPDACYVKYGIMPTRALGDFVFKFAEFNTSPVQEERGNGRHIAAPYTPPYLEAVPEVLTRTLTADDKFLILASDGVWDFLDNDQAVAFVQQHIASGKTIEASRALVEYALTVATAKEGKTLADFAALSPGDGRRDVHDDTTVVILFFE